MPTATARCDICAFNRDDDRDGDGICALDAAGALDNSPAVANADQLDTDGDSGGNACDLDGDGDGAEDVADNCPLVANADQADFDGDSQGDACDADIDGGGVNDAQDVCLGSMPGEAVVLDLNSEELGCSIAQLCPCANPSGWRNHDA